MTKRVTKRDSGSTGPPDVASQRRAWVFDVDGCLVDLTGGTTLRPLARELLEQLASRDIDTVLWSAGGAQYAARRAQATGIADLIVAYYDKAERDPDGRWSAAHIHARHMVITFVDDQPGEIPDPVIGVSPYIGGNTHDRAFAELQSTLSETLSETRQHPWIPGGGPQSVAAVLDHTVAASADSEAIVSRHARLTYAQLDDAAWRAVTVLTDVGVQPGDRVAASMGNHAELVVAFLAAMRMGAIWLGINRSAAADEAAFMLDDSGATVLIGDRAVRSSWSTALGDRDLRFVEAEPGDDTCEWSRLLAGAPRAARSVVDPFGPAAIAYTSGTTGRPKGVVHSQHNLLLPVANGSGLDDGANARPAVCLPVTILNLMILGPIASWASGLVCVLMDRVDAEGIATWVRQERVSSFSAVPAMVYDLLTNPAVDQNDLISLTRPGVGGSDCPPALRDLYQRRFGTRITTAYGLTEAPTIVTIEDPAGPAVLGSAGRAAPQLNVSIRDADGIELPTDEIGEICVAPATTGPLAGVYTPMLEYWRRPEATAEAMRGGVLHTGDLGRLDTDGNLFVTGRKNDLIIRGGANVYPAEVERVLAEHSCVAASVVIGVPDDRLGERVVAAVVPAPGSTPTAEDLRAHCAASLARYKVPEQFLVVESLPRNAMGKVLRATVAELFV
jgi:long-chain acyl-CoA synthetase